MMDYTPQTFAQALLTKLGYTPTKLSVSDVMSWEAAEGGNWGNSAKYNPLNSCQPMPSSIGVIQSAPGSSLYVQAYKSWSDGLTATAKNLQNGRYSTILEALQYGDQNFGSIVAASPWGTGTFSVNVQPKLPVTASATAPDISKYPGMTVKNGVYHITYSASTGAKMANFMGDPSAISAIATWNSDSVMEAKRYGVGTQGYYAWLDVTLSAIFGPNSATSPAGGSSGATSDITDLAGMLGLSNVKWWEIIIVILAGVLVVGIILKTLGSSSGFTPKQAIAAVA
jgi:hypothetical protein